MDLIESEKSHCYNSQCQQGEMPASKERKNSDVEIRTDKKIL